MTPKNNYLILKQFEKKHEEVTKSGLVVPTDVLEDRDSTGAGQIYAVCDESEYRMGMIVVFSKFVPIGFRLGEEEFLAIKENDIICTLPDDESSLH